MSMVKLIHDEGRVDIHQSTDITRFKSHKLFVYFCTTVVILVLVGVSFFLINNGSGQETRVARGAVVTNGYICAQIGASILKRGGSAVDAAIASLFCEGVSMPQSMGLGGGFIMTIYDKASGRVEVLNARETAPAGAHETMFNGDVKLSTKGGLAVAIPGELRGYWEAYKKYGGKVPWEDLVKPTIDLCKNGILQTKYLAKNHRSQTNQLYKDPALRHWYNIVGVRQRLMSAIVCQGCSNTTFPRNYFSTRDTFIDPQTNNTYLEGQLVKRLRLAKTLELIAEFGADVLYNGSLTKRFVEDIRGSGGIITESDMNNYQAEWQEPVKVQMPFDQVLFSAPPPGSGVILSFIFNILNGFLDYSQPLSIQNWQKIVESFKYAYARRTELGDLNFDSSELRINGIVDNLTSANYGELIKKKIYVNQTFQDPAYYGAKTSLVEDHGTAHVSVLSPNGDAVSVTSTINLFFGAGFMSNSTGIILNDEMDDFASPNITSSFDLPPSVANFIRPGKRPFSSMCPSIIIGEGGDVRLVVGAAGGTKITTSVALITIKNLWFNFTIQQAVDDRRLHHQLFPMLINFEADYGNDTEFVNALHNIGHQYVVSDSSSGFSAVTAISRKGGTLETATDKRRSGDMTYIY